MPVEVVGEEPWKYMAFSYCVSKSSKVIPPKTRRRSKGTGPNVRGATFYICSIYSRMATCLLKTGTSVAPNLKLGSWMAES